MDRPGGKKISAVLDVNYTKANPFKRAVTDEEWIIYSNCRAHILICVMIMTS